MTLVFKFCKPKLRILIANWRIYGRYYILYLVIRYFSEKREEDKNKLKELDRLRIGYQNLVEFKTAVLDEQRLLREKLEDTETVNFFF